MSLLAGWVNIYSRALDFAAQAHGEQKTPKGLPYIVHVAAVAAETLAALAAEDHDAELAVPCALLHDVMEDTMTTLADIEAAFGPRVAAGVSALTKDDSLPKERRMADSLDRILRQPPEIAVVKLADRMTNLAPPPAQWTPGKISAYREESREILRRLGPASSYLAARLARRLQTYPT